MGDVRTIDIKTQVNHHDIIRVQINNYCYLNNISISDSDLECLTVLAIAGEVELSSFCSDAAERKIYKNAQVVRNAIGKAVAKELVVKDGVSRKRIKINPDIKIHDDENLLVRYQFLKIAPKEL